MTSKQQAIALKKLADTLAQEGDQWLLEEPFIWEKDPEWPKGDVEPYPHNLNVTPTREALKAGAAIDAIVKNSPFSEMFVSVFRDGEMMILSIPGLHDVMVPFTRGSQVWLSEGEGSSWDSDYIQPYYDIYPRKGTMLWVNGERVEDLENVKALTDAGLRVLGQWGIGLGEGIASRCQGKHPLVCVRQEHWPPEVDRPWSVHGPIWADPTCIFYREVPRCPGCGKEGGPCLSIVCGAVYSPDFDED